MARKQKLSFGSTYRRGRVWWIQYRHKGEQVREPGGLDGRGARTKEEAESKLKQRLGEMAVHAYTGPEAERLTVDTILDDYEAHLKTKGAKSLKQTKCHVAPIRETFGRDRALHVATAQLRDYIAAQLEADYAPATVNRGLQAMRAAFNLARKEDRLPRLSRAPALVRSRIHAWAAHCRRLQGTRGPNEKV